MDGVSVRPNGKILAGVALAAVVTGLLVVGGARPGTASAQEPAKKKALGASPLEPAKGVSSGTAQPVPLTNRVRPGFTPMLAWDLGDRSTWPAVTEVSPSSCIRIGAVLTVKGRRFGTRERAGPALQLTVGQEPKGSTGTGVKIERVLSWSDTSVSFLFPRVTGVEPGTRASVAFSLKGRVLAARSVQVCSARTKRMPPPSAKKSSAVATLAGAQATPVKRSPDPAAVAAMKPRVGAVNSADVKIVSPAPTSGGAPREPTETALRSPTVSARRASRGEVFRVKVGRELMSKVSFRRRKIPVRVARDFEIPMTPEGPPSETPPEFSPVQGAVDPPQDAGPRAGDCPEGDPNCPDVEKPGDGAIDPPEWHVDVQPGCPPLTMGCDVVVVKVWPDGDPVPGDDPEEVDCTKVNLPGTKFCGFIIGLEKPDILGDPVAQDSGEDDINFNEDQDGTCNGYDEQSGTYGSCEDEWAVKCEGDMSGSSCTQYNEDSQCPDGPDSPGCQTYYDAYFQGDDENMTDEEKKEWAETTTEELTGMNCDATMSGGGNVNVACHN